MAHSMRRLIGMVLVIFMALLAWIGSGVGAEGVIEVTPDNVEEKLYQNPKPVFAVFHVSWCGHCKKFLPLYKRFVEQWNEEQERSSVVDLLSIDCTEYSDICLSEDVNGYPTARFYAPYRESKTQFSKSRSFKGLNSFLNEKLSVEFVVKDPEIVSDGIEEATHLDFDDKVLVKGKKTLVFFYADWCGHCSNVKPTVSQLAKEYQNDAVIQIIKVNAAEDQGLAKRFNIRGFPTFLLFTGRNDNGVPYQGDRSFNDFKKFILSGGANQQRRQPPGGGGGRPAGPFDMSPIEQLLKKQNDIFEQQNKLLKQIVTQLKVMNLDKDKDDGHHDEL